MKIKSETNETWYDSGIGLWISYSMIFYNRLFSYIQTIVLVRRSRPSYAASNPLDTISFQTIIFPVLVVLGVSQVATEQHLKLNSVKSFL